MTLRIDMLIGSKDLYSLHKFDVGKTRQKFHVTLKPNVELKRQRASKVPLLLKDKLEKHNLRTPISFEKWAMMTKWDRFLLTQ